MCKLLRKDNSLIEQLLELLNIVYIIIHLKKIHNHYGTPCRNNLPTPLANDDMLFIGLVNMLIDYNLFYMPCKVSDRFKEY